MLLESRARREDGCTSARRGGFGISHTFANRITPILEVDTVARLDAAQGDLGITLTFGVRYSF